MKGLPHYGRLTLCLPHNYSLTLCLSHYRSLTLFDILPQSNSLSATLPQYNSLFATLPKSKSVTLSQPSNSVSATLSRLLPDIVDLLGAPTLSFFWSAAFALRVEVATFSALSCRYFWVELGPYTLCFFNVGCRVVTCCFCVSLCRIGSTFACHKSLVAFSGVRLPCHEWYQIRDKYSVL